MTKNLELTLTYELHKLVKRKIELQNQIKMGESEFYKKELQEIENQITRKRIRLKEVERENGPAMQSL